MPLELYWDEAGDPRAGSAAPDDLLARYLESDIGTSRRQCREVLEAIDHLAESSGGATWADTGNAHTLRLSPHGAEIESSFDTETPPRHLTLGELRAAVADWLAFLERGRQGRDGQRSVPG